MIFFSEENSGVLGNDIVEKISCEGAASNTEKRN
jgi:hypothetical protein